MKIKLSNIGKRFNNQWIFRGIDKTFESGKSYAFLGGNGSGKSTLLQIVSGYSTATEGEMSFEIDGNKMEDSEIFKNISIAAPYLELLEEFTLNETIDFHFKFKKKCTGNQCC